jgi:hypothetical protein
MILSREAILGAQDLQTQEVNVPEWGGSVIVRGMTGAERDAFEASIMDLNNKDSKINFQDMRAKLLSKCLADEKGNRLFSDADIEALSGKAASALNRLFEVAQHLCGLSKTDMDELLKNSEAAQTEDSPSN